MGELNYKCLSIQDPLQLTGCQNLITHSIHTEMTSGKDEGELNYILSEGKKLF